MRYTDCARTIQNALRLTTLHGALEKIESLKLTEAEADAVIQSGKRALWQAQKERGQECYSESFSNCARTIQRTQSGSSIWKRNIAQREKKQTQCARS